MKRLVIIDSYALAHRAYHALPPLMSSEGVLVNGVYGFMLVFLKMINDLKPDYLVATFDLAKPTFRHEEYHDYKAKRIKAPDNFYDQVRMLKDILTAWEIPLLAKEGYEADDIIGTLVNKFKEQDLEIIILTGDLDTLQLINEKTKVYTLRKGVQDSIIYDLKAIKEKYNLLPEQLIDLKALKGDPSDNISGVPGIGEKTALKLIQEFGSLDNLYQSLEKQDLKAAKINPKLKEKLLTYKKEAYLSQHLVKIDTDVDLDFQLESSVFKPPVAEKISPLFKKLGFQSLINRLFTPAQSKISQRPQYQKREITAPLVKDKNFQLLEEKIKNNAICGVYLDYEGNKFGERKIKKLYFIFPESEIFVVPSFLINQISLLKLFSPEQTIYTWGAKAVIEEIPNWVNLQFIDLEILAWLIDANRKNYQLDSLIKFFLKHETSPEIEDNLDEFLPLATEIKNKASGLGLDNVWLKIEQPLIRVLARMEINGIYVNQEILSSLLQEIKREIKNLETQIYHLAQKEFNINSYQQLGKILFEDLKIKPSGFKKTRSGKMSTDIDELEKIKNLHPIIPLIIDYRGLIKAQTSFLEPLPTFINPVTQRIHTIWKQTGTATGRLSSEEPNLQNIPNKGAWGQKIREAFEAPRGFCLISLDYSQIELRIAAHLSLDPKLIEAFKQDKDIHTITASYINNVSEDQVTSQMRQLAKILNFGIIYGMGEKAISAAANIELKEAKKFKEEYFHDFEGLKRYLEYSLAQAKELGYAETIFGRKRFLPLIGSLGQLGRQEERAAVNMPIQGLAADIIKLAMIQINEFIKKEHLEDELKLILQIHDELILEAKSEIIKEVSPKLKEIMEQVVKLDVPLKAEVKIGTNWGQL
ncbi:MAG: DNA polymerase I [Parcubacteria group bacterium]|nr:DNA polymerase I [Parcubacteria group bacterium]